MDIAQILLILAVVTTALTAGLFFGFQVAINPAFKQLSDVQYIAAMQSINRVIVNPLFIFCFLGAAFFLPLAAWLSNDPQAKYMLWLSAACYILGCLIVTMGINVPLNNALDKFALQTSSAEEIARARSNFAAPWNKWHLVRTIANIIALVLAVLACL